MRFTSRTTMSSASSDRRRDSSGEDDAKTAYTVGTSVQGSELTEGPTAPSNNTPVYAYVPLCQQQRRANFSMQSFQH